MTRIIQPLVGGALLALVFNPAVATDSVRSYARVNDDASLRIQGKTVELRGVYIPTTERSCIDEVGDDCRTRAADALDFRVQGFIECRSLIRTDRRRLAGYCYVDRTPFDRGTDLGAYLIERGWALAGPAAPFEYRALERIARETERGLWWDGIVRTRRKWGLGWR